ncbi:MAG: hypothetical protein FJZ01_16970 [Candidatus Sericytochromatia bacterium]|nr:hypothetical protein [Candidatus Tanganyikabacteria bacterium]
MAFLSFTRPSLPDWIPFFGGKGKNAFEKNFEKADGKLKIKEAERSQQALNGLLGFDEFGMKCGSVTGDKVVVDTGKKLVQIEADKLDLSGVKKGDKVEFELDDKLDPGDATKVSGKVVVALDGPDPSKAQVDAVDAGDKARARDIEKPLADDDPVSDLITRRALLFQSFKTGAVDQDGLKLTWDNLRREALNKVVDADTTEFEKQAALQQMMDIGAFTPDEATDLGFQVVSNRYGLPDYIPI